MAKKFVNFNIRVSKKEVDNTLKSFGEKKGRTVRVVLPQRGKTTKIIDQELTAMPPGKRVSRTGKTYWETRANRSDKNPSTRL